MSKARRLAAIEFRFFWLDYVFSALFFILYSLYIALMITEAYEGDKFAMGFLDFVILMFAQILGLGLTRNNFKNPFRHDPHTQKVRMMKRLPVRSRDIAAARLIPVIVLTIVNGAGLILPAYGVLRYREVEIGFPEIMTLLYFVILIGVSMGYLYAYLEIGYTSKVYFLLSTVAIGLLCLLLIVCWVNDAFLIYWLLQQAREGIHPVMYVWTLVLAGLMIYGCFHMVVRRLDRRDYYN